ncbi:unnamed protein product [Urochloa decumbens]|uniref:SWIM-type domain-containing protein n=1 Tax=Urochloa decumbens TaxID=240449 RepID=A0ABC9CU09_9POAL
MDLNELPPEFDSDFLDDSSGNPFYCTQPSMYNVSSVGQQSGSLQNQFAVTYSEQFGSPQDHDHVTNAIRAREQFDAGASEQVAIGAKEQFDAGGSEHFDVGVNEHVDVTNEAPIHQGISVSGFEAHGGDENVVGDIAIEDADEIDDEIWSTPPIPYTGQSFDNKKEARQFYNMYAKRIGFSIRTGTTRLAAITREQRKVTYVCNKEGRGRKAKEDKANDESDEDESIEEISEQEDNNDGAGKKRKKLDGGKKRKREKMQHTNCKAKLVLNLIGVRWQVTDFVSEHNHDLILKPSLKKFLRNHKGIPQAEKEFIILLHGCNLTTGRIMQLMNEFYGSAQVVPYVGKDVSNFRSTIRRREKYKDMQETLDYFIELEEDPEFFYKSTQRSEGFNAVLKKYVNPNMSILHFVRQYQKVQEKCLVAEEGQDFKTDDRERRRWSKYPIERHAASVYTKNLFYRFSKEFEKTAEYDVKPADEFQYLLVPNNTTVYGYGKREYLVTAIEGDNSYFCECSKFDRDGILCCHIMKIMTRFGVKTIPDRYVLRRWTQKAVEDSEKCASNAHLQADLIARGMPLNNRKTLWFSVLSTSFADLAAEGCLSNERYTIMQRHIKEMRSEISAIKERKKAKRQKMSNTLVLNPAIIGQAQVEPSNVANTVAPTASGDNGVPPSIPTSAGSMAAVGNPPRSNVKGRKKEKRFKKGMNAEPKRKNKCRLCKSTEHNAARCPMKGEEKGLDLGGVTAQ